MYIHCNRYSSMWMAGTAGGVFLCDVFNAPSSFNNIPLHRGHFLFLASPLAAHNILPL